MFALNRDNVIPLLTQAMETQGPEFIYEGSCRYNPAKVRSLATGNTHLTGCLIGTMFSLNGSPISDDLQVGEQGDTAIRVLMPILLETNVVEIPAKDIELVTEILTRTQESQDHSASWGECVERAKAILERGN